MPDYDDELARIAAALTEAAQALSRFTPGEVASRAKRGGDPVTEADTLVDALLRRALPRAGEGWLSEETHDDRSRLGCSRVWVVDPLDGTREFVQGLPEWSVSVALVVDGEPVAGGICNPARGETFLGARGQGVTLDGVPVRVSPRAGLAGAEVLASRTEVERGQWRRFAGAPGAPGHPGAPGAPGHSGAPGAPAHSGAPFQVVAMGSVAYKLARVAAGLADATWTLVPKHEWDVAAGVALVLAAGGRILAGSPEEHRFNRPEPLLTRLIAAPPQLLPEIEREIARSA
jgi:myo-inositol-1(or 4)-monophosphatase